MLNKWSRTADRALVTQFSPVVRPCRDPARSRAPGYAQVLVALLAVLCGLAASSCSADGSATAVGSSGASTPLREPSAATTKPSPTTVGEPDLIATDDFVETVDFDTGAVEADDPTVGEALTTQVPEQFALVDGSTETSPDVSEPPQPDKFSLPPAPTIPKEFVPADIALTRSSAVDGVSFGIPRGWLLLSAPEDVAAVPDVPTALRTMFLRGLDGDPNRRFLLPQRQLDPDAPTWASIAVTAPIDFSAQEVSSRLEQFAVQAEGLRVVARANRSWLERRGAALLLKGSDQRRRLSISVRLADRRTVTVQTDGYGDDLPAIQALLALSVVPGPAVPLPSSTVPVAGLP